MRKKLISLVAMSVFVPSILTGCDTGGGDSSDSSSATNSTTNSTTTATYYGAASAGDFAEFTFDGKTITYTLEGPVFGNISGSFPIQIHIQKPFYKGYEEDTPVYLMLAGNIGFASVYENGKEVLLVGLKESGSLTEEEIVNKKFIYTTIHNDLSVANLSIEFNNDKTWKTYDTNGNEVSTGSWQLIDGKYINLTDEAGNIISKVVIKPGVNRAGFVVDLRDNVGGFGVGLEQKALTKEDIVGTYYYYSYDNVYDEDCYGIGKVYYDDTTGDYKYTSKTIWCDLPEDIGLEETGTLVLNEPITGMAIATDSKTGYKSSIFLDTEDGYFIAFKYDNNGNIVEYIIGSNKVE